MTCNRLNKLCSFFIHAYAYERHHHCHHQHHHHRRRRRHHHHHHHHHTAERAACFWVATTVSSVPTLERTRTHYSARRCEQQRNDYNKYYYYDYSQTADACQPVIGLSHLQHFLAKSAPKQSMQWGLSSLIVYFSAPRGLLQFVQQKHSLWNGESLHFRPPLLITCNQQSISKGLRSAKRSAPSSLTLPVVELKCNVILYSFIHSFSSDISKAPLQIHYYSDALPTTALILCRS